MWAVGSPGDIVTEESLCAKVARLTIALGAKLEIFHCVYDADVGKPERFGSRGAELDIQEIVEQRRRQLARNAEHLHGMGVQVRASVRWDSPAYEGIVRQVLRTNTDLLVARASQGGEGGLPLRRNDIKLIEACPCPLLLIKTASRYAAGPVVAAIDPAGTRDKPRNLDAAIVDAARMVAEALALKLIVFHVRETGSSRSGGDGSKATDIARRFAVDVQNVRIDEGRIEDRFAELMRSQGADIVALGAVNRSVLKRVVIGHTAERLLNVLDCDLLITKVPGFRTPVRENSVHHVDCRATERGRYVLRRPPA